MYSGQIEQGDILRVSKRPRGEFVDAVTVDPGSRVTVGLRLSNPGPGDVGDVKARVVVPKRAASALKLKLIVSWDGVTGRDRTTDTATIFVSPSNARACARYIPQSTRERQGDGPRTPVSLDWITSESGAYFGQFGSSLRDVRFAYFDVMVI